MNEPMRYANMNVFFSQKVCYVPDMTSLLDPLVPNFIKNNFDSK